MIFYSQFLAYSATNLALLEGRGEGSKIIRLRGIQLSPFIYLLLLEAVQSINAIVVNDYHHCSFFHRSVIICPPIHGDLSFIQNIRYVALNMDGVHHCHRNERMIVKENMDLCT